MCLIPSEPWGGGVIKNRRGAFHRTAVAESNLEVKSCPYLATLSHIYFGSPFVHCCHAKPRVKTFDDAVHPADITQEWGEALDLWDEFSAGPWIIPIACGGEIDKNPRPACVWLSNPENVNFRGGGAGRVVGNLLPVTEIVCGQWSA